MDVKYINPFLKSFMNVMPQLGLADIKRGKVTVKGNSINSSGVMIIIGIVGDIKGNVMYSTTIDAAKKIASTMMMGMEVTELDEMAQSAVSELTNMLTANAATNFADEDVNIDISTPALMYGDFTASASYGKVLCIEMFVNDMPFEINISLNVM
ncbi:MULTISPECIES: chemotaxis protein CheX [Clostridium]|uniref:chemotaxis protein CheX n=1 Tax=Clostridium TaxID=1485 RepID=UPI000826E899|nr:MULTISPECIES: chemotaxis protein CheX [Clostridium]PJI07768.1 chemotaxis protein CheX [Clostridium sp. CT7]